MKRAVVLFAFVFAIAAAIVACLDMTPITVTPPGEDAAPSPIVDAGPDAPDVDTRHPCQRCIETPDDGGGCGSELAACLADPQCNEIYQCVLSNGCLDKPTNRATTICSLPCAAEAGVFDLTSTPAVLAITVVNCGEVACRGICVPEAGTD
jgi:hypothetical protein